MIITFDLDDTLYDESSFVKSGLEAVSKYLYDKFLIPKKESRCFFDNELINGRENILDKVLFHFNIHNKKEVSRCLSIYRSHEPNIKLFPDAEKALKRFEKNCIYVLTDGNKIVQKNKIFALGLQNKVKSCILTSNFGIKHSKPSSYCFFHICKKENILPNELVYVGDNPNKDFVEIKKFGFKTIRVLTGRYKHVKKDKEYEADITIRSLRELTSKLIQK